MRLFETLANITVKEVLHWSTLYNTVYFSFTIQILTSANLKKDSIIFAYNFMGENFKLEILVSNTFNY